MERDPDASSKRQCLQQLLNLEEVCVWFVHPSSTGLSWFSGLSCTGHITRPQLSLASSEEVKWLMNLGPFCKLKGNAQTFQVKSGKRGGSTEETV